MQDLLLKAVHFATKLEHSGKKKKLCILIQGNSSSYFCDGLILKQLWNEGTEIKLLQLSQSTSSLF